jgi:hypothetical protein
MNESETEKLMVRVPADVKRWIAGQAKYHVTSMNAAVIAAIRAQMAATERRRQERVAG